MRGRFPELQNAQRGNKDSAGFLGGCMDFSEHLHGEARATAPSFSQANMERNHPCLRRLPSQKRTER